MIKLGDLIENLGIVHQGLKTVGKTFGDIEHTPIFPGQFHGNPLSEGRRIPAQVYNHIIQAAPGAANHLFLGMGRRLIMHPPQGARIPVEGDIALRHLRVQPPPGKLIPTE